MFFMRSPRRSTRTRNTPRRLASITTKRSTTAPTPIDISDIVHTSLDETLAVQAHLRLPDKFVDEEAVTIDPESLSMKLSSMELNDIVDWPLTAHWAKTSNRIAPSVRLVPLVLPSGVVIKAPVPKKSVGKRITHSLSPLAFLLSLTPMGHVTLSHAEETRQSLPDVSDVQISGQINGEVTVDQFMDIIRIDLPESTTMSNVGLAAIEP